MLVSTYSYASEWARILTSAKCVALFKEKEDKKKKELKEKERRKQEGELKKNKKAGSKPKKKTTSVTPSSTHNDNYLEKVSNLLTISKIFERKG